MRRGAVPLLMQRGSPRQRVEPSPEVSRYRQVGEIRVDKIRHVTPCWNYAGQASSGCRAASRNSRIKRCSYTAESINNDVWWGTGLQVRMSAVCR